MLRNSGSIVFIIVFFSAFVKAFRRKDAKKRTIIRLSGSPEEKRKRQTYSASPKRNRIFPVSKYTSEYPSAASWLPSFTQRMKPSPPRGSSPSSPT